MYICMYVYMYVICIYVRYVRDSVYLHPAPFVRDAIFPLHVGLCKPLLHKTHQETGL